MRLRTSAAITLVAALLASAAAPLVCLADCDVATPARAVRVAAPDQATGTCHRENDVVPADRASLTRSPHDCGSHSTAPTALSNPKTGAPSLLGAEARALAPSPVGTMLSANPSGANAVIAAHDLAPPGVATILIAPLRI